MPYVMRKLPKQDLYRVYNPKTKEVHSYGTTLENAKKQITLLNMIDAGVPLKKQKGKGAGASIMIQKLEDELADNPITFIDNGVVMPSPMYSSTASLNTQDYELSDEESLPETFEIEGGSIQNPKMLELFKGTGSVGKQAKRMGFKVVSLDLEPHYTPDIETDILDWDYKKWANENNYVPDMIWASPPCNTFSPLAYRLKERDTKTAKPISERAKLGTKVLYKTLEIIDYFRSKNPKLLFVIENPRGMMRMDAKMMKLAKETTLYCIYGDFKKKPTDFFNNFPDGLGLKVDTQCPKGSKTFPLEKLTLEQRYSIPSKLIKKILEEFKKQYGKKVGSGVELDKFKEEEIVSLPKFSDVNITLPTYMYKENPSKQSKYKYVLATPTTKTRHLATRKNEGLSVNVERKPIENVVMKIEEPTEVVKITDFKPSDQAKIRGYYEAVERNEGRPPERIPNELTQNAPRGFPATLYKNARRAGLTLDPNTTTYRKNNKKAKAPSIRQQKKQQQPPSAPLTTETLSSRASSRNPSVASSKKSSKKDVKEIVNPEIVFPDEELSELSSLPSLAKDSSVSSKSSKKSSKSSVSSESSVSTAKSSKSSKSKKSTDTIDTGDMSLGSEDVDDFLAKYGIKGKGIENKISNKSIGMNSWVQHCKAFAAKKGIKYNEALKDPECKATYKKGDGLVQDVKSAVKSASKKVGLGQCGMGIIDEAAAAGYADQVLIADAYNQKNLGSQKKYISL